MSNRNKTLDSPLIENTARNIKQIRLKLGLSQEDLAALSGLHRTYIGSVERGERNITLTTLEKLSETLGVAPEKLLEK
ncbi:MAG: helix-turn-helix transcriptional regulator [Pseudomonadales bacterium]|nr:helix-turn-helix transcriptional regulator [Pseudomonadales bacterium]